MSVEVDVWYVKLADGDVDRVTLDELDAAFQNGQIDENSMVLAAGTDQWMKLGELLGAADATPPPPPPTPVPETSAQPLAALAPVQSVAQPPAMVRPGSPMQAPMQRPTQAPVHPVITMAPPPALPNVPVANTLRPMSFDLEADDIQFPRGRSGKGKLVAVLAVAVLGAAAFVVAKRGALSASAGTSPPTFAAAAQPPAPAPPPPETAAPTPPSMQASMAGPSSVMDPTRMDGTQRLSDTQKQKLLEADKKVKTHERSHGGGAAVSHASASKSRSSSGAFTTSGNKYDPLNSSL